MKRDGFYRPVLGTPIDETMTEVHRPGESVYKVPVYRNKIRRGTLIVKTFSYTNGGISVKSEYVTEPWEESEPFVRLI